MSTIAAEMGYGSGDLLAALERELVRAGRSARMTRAATCVAARAGAERGLLAQPVAAYNLVQMRRLLAA